MAKEALVTGLGYNDANELDSTISLFESSHDLLRFGGRARRLGTSKETKSMLVLAEEFLEPRPEELSRRLTGQGIVPMIIPEREDLLDQHARVEAAWTSFKEHLTLIGGGITTLNKKDKKD